MNCLPPSFEETNFVASYSILFDKNGNLIQRWNNLAETISTGYGSLLKNSQKSLEKFNLGGFSLPFNDAFNCPINGHLYLRVEGLFFDNPNNATYYSVVGTHTNLKDNFVSQVSGLVKSDLTLFYIISLVSYISLYAVATIILEIQIGNKILKPIIDLTERIKNPKEMNERIDSKLTT